MNLLAFFDLNADEAELSSYYGPFLGHIERTNAYSAPYSEE